MPRGKKSQKAAKVAALMANIKDDEEKEKAKPVSHPPTSYDKFLETEEIKVWPQPLTSEGMLDSSALPGDITKDDINVDLANSAPFGLNTFDVIESSLDDYEERLMAFIAFLTNPTGDNLPSRLEEKLFHAPRKEYLEQAANAVAVQLHPSHRVVKTDMKKALEDEAIALKTRNISFFSFLGFRSRELTELPSQLEAPQLLNKVTEARTFSKGFLPLWKKLFLSEASAAILHDAFWWIFLEMFESNPDAQDRIYTRLAGSYIALFNSVHPDIRDKFFTEYPRCLSQAVYLTFFEAFTESHEQFGEEFISEISFHIYQWVSGVKPPVGHWRSWPVDKLCSQAAIGTRRSMTPFETRSGIRSQPDIPSSQDMKFDINDLIPASTTATFTHTSSHLYKPDEVTASSVRHSHGSVRGKPDAIETQGKSSVPALPRYEDSAPAGRGPDIQRVLFNLSGRSPLVAHYLYIKNLKEKETLGKMMKRTEVIREPPPGLTYKDVIRNSQRTVRTVREQRLKSEKDTEEFIKKLHYQHMKAIQKLKEAEKTILDPVNLKLRSDKVLDEAQEKGYLRRASKGAEEKKKDNSNAVKELLK